MRHACSRAVRLDLVAVSSCQLRPEPLEVAVMLSLLGVAVGAAYHVVSAFAQVLAPLAGGLATAAAIVGCTMAVRLLLLPLSYYAIRGQASQARLLPQARALQKHHAGQPDRLQSELAALYRRGGNGVVARCPPPLPPPPVFRVLVPPVPRAPLGRRPHRPPRRVT